MMEFSFNNKTFILLENSANGTADSATVFSYRQKGDIITACYSGGMIRHGSITGRIEGHYLQLLYQCLTTANELKAGKAVAFLSMDQNNKIRMKMNWEWLMHEQNDGRHKGSSEYIEK
jgi:hypothetical protein